jgi:hypothetical protein
MSESTLTSNRPFVYYRIPQLRELMPKTGGLPGVTYLQCAVINLRKAQDDQWKRVVNSSTYTIVGPEGEIDCELLCKGRPIPGGDVFSGRRSCEVDTLIEEITRIPIDPSVVPEPSPVQTITKPKAEPEAVEAS